MNDPAQVSDVDSLGYRSDRCGRLAGRLGHARHFLSQAAPLDEFHREVRSPIRVADGVDLRDIRVTQAGHGFCFAQEPLQLLGPGVGSGEKHFQGDGALEAQVPGF